MTVRARDEDRTARHDLARASSASTRRADWGVVTCDFGAWFQFLATREQPNHLGTIGFVGQFGQDLLFEVLDGALVINLEGNVGLDLVLYQELHHTDEDATGEVKHCSSRSMLVSPRSQPLRTMRLWLL